MSTAEVLTAVQRIPRENAHQVRRARLDPHLHGVLEGATRAVAVWGAAGSGKTTLLADWARAAERHGTRAVWIHGSELGPRMEFDVLAARFPLGSENTVIFLDDAHVVPRQSRATIEQLLEAVPEHLRVVLAGRYDPSTRHTHLQALGTLVEVHDAELAFTETEARELAALHELSLPPAAADALVQRTGGWATGIALAMPWLSAHPDVTEAVRHFDGDNRAVADYLVTEIVELLPEPDRAVLMAAAVAPAVPLELAVLLSGRADAGTVLERLAGHNTLLSRSDECESFCYHPILLAFLEAETRRRDLPGAIARHETAASWFADRGDGEHALEQAVKSTSAGSLRDQLERFGAELVFTGHSEPVVDALRARPVSDSAAAAVIRLLLDSPSHQWSPVARSLLATAERSIAAEAARPEAERWAAILEVVRAFRADEPADAHEALRTLGRDGIAALRWRDVAVDLLASTAEGCCLLRLGHPAKARELLLATVESARSLGYDWLVLLAADLAVEPAISSGDWHTVQALERQLMATGPAHADVLDRPAARAQLFTALRHYERCERVDVGTLHRLAAATDADPGIVVPATTIALLSDLQTGDSPRLVLEELTEHLERWGAGFPRAVAVACLPMFQAADQLIGAHAAENIVRLTGSCLGSGSLEFAVLRFVSAPDARPHGPAEAALLDALTSGRNARRAGTVIAGWIASARFAESTAREVEADARIRHALVLAHDLQVERPFLYFDGAGARMLAARAGRLGRLDGPARQITDRTTRIRCDEPAHPVGNLTPRELDLLRELPMHQTVAEIARRHSVSANTVKTHLRSIYQKLGATDRGSAVEIAQRTGLL
jgi:LuxR family maltose regulon positive regulatory protein